MVTEVKTRSIRCPACKKGKILDAVIGVNNSVIKVYPPPQNHLAQYFVKCPNCKSQIGIESKQ